MKFMKLKKNMSVMLAIALISSALIGCSNTSSDEGESAQNTRKANNELIAAIKELKEEVKGLIAKAMKDFAASLLAE